METTTVTSTGVGVFLYEKEAKKSANLAEKNRWIQLF